MSILCAVIGWIFLGSELALAWRRRSSGEANSRDADRGSLKLLWRVIGSADVAGWLLALYHVGPRLPAGIGWARAGLGVFVVGTIVRWWAIWHLGRFFTVNVALADHHLVVDTGPYRWVRHPSYSGLLLQFAGFALSLNNALALPVILLPVAWALGYRIRVEEAALSDFLGDAYKMYTNRTKKLVPLVY